MKATEIDGGITIEFPKDEALVFFEWLSRLNESEKSDLFEDDAEQFVLWDIECEFESILVEPFDRRYGELLNKARLGVRQRRLEKSEAES